MYKRVMSNALMSLRFGVLVHVKRTNVCVFVCVCVNVCACVCACVYIQKFVTASATLSMSVSVSVSAYAYACVCVCACACAYKGILVKTKVFLRTREKGWKEMHVVYCLFLGKQHAIVVASDIPLAERARKFDADASVKNVGDNTV